MSYVVLARKWRPMSFRDLVGQDHVAQTLGNAIVSGRVAHAFLFTGVRGVGKTTSARILAKALNCMGSEEVRASGVDPGPTVEPCLTCPACLEIALGTDVDVREIDGASYNGVEEVRRLQESLPYRPGRDRYKIIIVDEVHMLSNSAWNAFLKTLEEPPPHVKFIFATTEVHKVPITILSRVQRFDFKMIPARTVGQRLRYVLEQEGISADDEAVSLIAHKAAGSMRDGMSLLDQVIAFSGTELRGSDVAQVLGVASRTAVLEVARALVSAESEACLNQVADLHAQGFDMTQLAKDLLGVLRDLVVARISPNAARLIDASDDETNAIVALAKVAEESDLLRLHQGFSRGFDEVVRGSDPRANLEMLLVRLSLRPPLLPLDELLHRIAGLERRLLGARPGDASADRGRRAPPPAARPPMPPHQPARAPMGATPERSPRAPRARPAEQEKADDEEPAPPPASFGEVPAPPPPPPPASSGEPAPPPAAPLDPAAYALESRLLEVLEVVRKASPQIAAYLEQTTLLSFEDGRLELGIEPGHLFEKEVASASTKAALEAALVSCVGDGATVVLRTEDLRAHPTKSVSAARARRRQAERDVLVQEVKNHPLVQEAIATLGARVKDVRIGEGPN